MARGGAYFFDPNKRGPASGRGGALYLPDDRTSALLHAPAPSVVPRGTGDGRG